MVISTCVSVVIIIVIGVTNAPSHFPNNVHDSGNSHVVTIGSLVVIVVMISLCSNGSGW
jgi:hypothetical protein